MFPESTSVYFIKMQWPSFYNSLLHLCSYTIDLYGPCDLIIYIIYDKQTHSCGDVVDVKLRCVFNSMCLANIHFVLV